MNTRQAIDELSTIKDFVRWGYSQLSGSAVWYGHGTDNPLDESLTLVLYALGLPHDTPRDYFDCKLTLDERTVIVEWIQRRITERLPAAYLTHEAWFAQIPFYVDERVLVPRSPIAELIEAQFTPWVEPDNVNRVLDMCTGSGCIAIACAYAFPHAEVDAVDISADALAVANINIERQELGAQVHAIESDLFTSLDKTPYDIIVSNPPYVSKEDMDAMPGEYHHEPALGLAAGDDGLDIAHRILREAPDYLSDQGILIVEVGNSQEALIEAYPKLPFMWLDFERGGEGVFLLTAEQLKQASLP